MEKTNNLADKLWALCKESRKSQAEFSKELGIPRSTIQAVMDSGNTTVDTLIRIANATGLSLDTLVYGEPSSPKDTLALYLKGLDFYVKLPLEKQSRLRCLLAETLELLLCDD